MDLTQFSVLVWRRWRFCQGIGVEPQEFLETVEESIVDELDVASGFSLRPRGQYGTNEYGEACGIEGDAGLHCRRISAELGRLVRSEATMSSRCIILPVFKLRSILPMEIRGQWPTAPNRRDSSGAYMFSRVA